MLWSKVIGAGGLGGETDIYWSDVSLLMKSDGTNGSTTITDSSSNVLTLAAVGNAQISTSTVKFGSGSVSLDGSGDYINASDPTVLNFGTGDYTLEGWFNFTSIATDRGLFAKFSTVSGTRGINLRYAPSVSGLRLVVGGTTTVLAQNGSFTPTLGDWYHVAYTNSASNHRVFVNGSSVIASSSNVGNIDTAVDFLIGSAQTVSNSDFYGFIDEVRVTKGVARYTANFTPPTAPFPTS